VNESVSSLLTAHQHIIEGLASIT